MLGEHRRQSHRAAAGQCRCCRRSGEGPCHSLGIASQAAHRHADIAQVAVHEQAAACRAACGQTPTAGYRSTQSSACRIALPWHARAPASSDTRVSLVSDAISTSMSISSDCGKCLHRCHQRGAGIGALRGDIDRVAGRAVGRHHRPQRCSAFRADRGGTIRPCSDSVSAIQAPPPPDGRDDAGAATLGQRAGQQHAGDRHGFVWIFRFDHAITFEDCAIGGVGA